MTKEKIERLEHEGIEFVKTNDECSTLVKVTPKDSAEGSYLTGFDLVDMLGTFIGLQEKESDQLFFKLKIIEAAFYDHPEFEDFKTKLTGDFCNASRKELDQ